MNNNNNMWQKYQNIPPQQSGQQGAVPQPQQPVEPNGQHGAVPQQSAEQNGQQGAVPQQLAEQNGQHGAVPQQFAEQNGQHGAVPQPQQLAEQNGQHGAVPQQSAEQNGQQVEKQNFGVNSDDASSQYGAYKPKYNYAALTKPDKNATGVIIGIIVFLVVLLLVGIVGFAITSGDDIEKGTQEFFDNLNSDNSSNGQYSDDLSDSDTVDLSRQTRTVNSQGGENKTITFTDPQGGYSLEENDTVSGGNYYGDNYYYYYNPSDESSIVISFDYGTAKEGVKFQREYYQSNNQSCDTYTWNTNFGETTALSITDTNYNVNETVSFVQLAESTYAYISLVSTDDFDSQRKAAEEIINSMQVQ